MRYIYFIFISLAVSFSANAMSLRDLYADMDAKIMASNSSIYSMYAPDAEVVLSNGTLTNPEGLRSIMNTMIHMGAKYNVYQSKIIQTHEIKSGIMKNLMGVIVVSEDYLKVSIPDDKDQSKKRFEEHTLITTRVFDTSTPNRWVIVSEQSTPVKKKEK